MKTNRALLYGVLGSVVILAGIIIYFLSGSSKDSDAQYQREMSSDKEPVVVEEGGVPVVIEDPESALERYREWSKYPPFSRPLYAGQVDLLNPFVVNPSPVAVLQSPAQDCKKTDDGKTACAKPPVLSDIECKMNAERYISVGRKDFRIFLSCSSKKQEGFLPIDSLSAKVYRDLFNVRTQTLPPIASGDTGRDGDEKANDHVYTFLVRPTLQDWGVMYLEAEFRVNGMAQVQRTDWYSTPHNIGEFRQGISDSNRNGQLIVSVPVTIIKEGYYKFDANLVEKSGEKRPVGTASWEGDLKPGPQTIELQFFGKVIKDKNIDGPYLVENIRGMRNNSPVTPSMLRAAFQGGRILDPAQTREPLQEYMEPAVDYTTNSYRSEEFSGDEWQSEDKEQRIRYLNDLVREEK